MAGDAGLPLKEPKELIVKDRNGKEHKFLMSIFPATVGRELTCNYVLSGLPKVGDYGLNAEMMQKLMGYVGVEIKGQSQPLRLTTVELVNNHVPDFVALGQIEIETMRYNSGFFFAAKICTFFDAIMVGVREKATSILMASLQPSSTPKSPPSEN